MFDALKSIPGRPFHGYFTSNDAQTAAAFSLYDAEHAAVTLAANEQLVIAAVELHSATSATWEVFDDADGDGTVDPGERIAVFRTAPTGTNMQQVLLPVPYYCTAGKTPKLKASGAGQVDAMIRGVIRTLTP